MTSSIRLSRSSSCITTRERKKVGKAHFFRTLARLTAAGKLPRAQIRPAGRSAGGEQLAHGRDDLVARHPALLPAAPRADLDEPALDPGVAEGDADGDAEQVRVLE